MEYFYIVITCIKILHLWRLHVAKHRDLILYYRFQGCRTATHNLITIRTMLLAWEVGVGCYFEGEGLQITLRAYWSSPLFFVNQKSQIGSTITHTTDHPHGWKGVCCVMRVIYDKQPMNAWQAARGWIAKTGQTASVYQTYRRVE